MRKELIELLSFVRDGIKESKNRSLFDDYHLGKCESLEVVESRIEKILKQAKDSPETVEKAKKEIRAVLQSLVDFGFEPYKTKSIEEKGDTKEIWAFQTNSIETAYNIQMFLDEKMRYHGFRRHANGWSNKKRELGCVFFNDNENFTFVIIIKY